MTVKTCFESTPIYYVNDVPHPGHAYTTIAADALARARRLRGHDVFFLTGTDEHGQNIERIAREKGLPTKEYCDQIAGTFRALWGRLGIGYDRFIRTTDEIHRRGVLKLWSALSKATAPNGQPAVYRGKYSGWYCPRCEAFKDDDELRQPGNLCAVHERPCEWTEEENFFFRLSAYGDWLRQEIERGRFVGEGAEQRIEGLLIEPTSRRNEVLSVIRQGLKDFSVSRARVRWGIPVPEQPDHVFYVWMDALANYITALGFADDALDYKRYWERAHERLHFVGKEIIRFHCLYWPAMLHAAGLPTPNRIFAHGWLTKDGKKLSKTTGNTIDPDGLIDRYGADAFRYFFLREGSFGQDWDFTESAFLKRYNSDLANDLGNLVSRALTMVERYCGGKVPPRSEPWGADPEAILARYEALDFSGALSLIWTKIGELNQRIVEGVPWELARDASRKKELDEFLYRLLEHVRLTAVWVAPVMPEAARRVHKMLGLERASMGPADVKWGVMDPGRPLGTTEHLFPRIETKEKTVSETTSTPHEASSDRIDIADFAKVELRAATITAAEKIEGSKRLIKLQVDLGSESRQVVAGLRFATRTTFLPTRDSGA